MRSALTIILVLFATQSWSATAGQQREQFGTEMANAVFTTALDFIAPRALEAVTVQQLALWGLGGITTLDASLTPEFADAMVTLRRGAVVLFQRAAPDPNSTEEWGALVTDMMAVAWTNSPIIQNGGNQVVISTFFDELFNHLDAYSRYVPPDAADEDRARRSGEAGAGLVLAVVRGAILVQTVNADGPAAEAGIVAGDQIVAVDDQPTRGEELETVLGWIGGVEGTGVTLTVRSRRGRFRKVDIERVVLPPETVFGSRMNDIVTIRITSFSSDTDQRFSRELERQLGRGGAAGVKGIIVDLRGNRGGLVRQAVVATDALLSQGVIATTAGRSPQAGHQWRASVEAIAVGKAVVVLVDGRTASAAEIMAAGLAGQGRAVVVGSSTLGKGLVQTISVLPDGGELFVSWSRVLAPGGWPLQGLGVLPQICTSLGADSVAEQLASLEHNELLLGPALVRHRASRAPLPASDIVEQRAACPAAEAREGDVTTAKYLFSHPLSYAAALLNPPPLSVGPP